MISEAQILEALRTVNDPDIGVNIVDLGLVEAVRPGTDESLDIDIIMTTPACPQSAFIQDEIERAIRRLEAAPATIRVTILSQPFWQPGRMTDAARAVMGWPAT